MSALRFRGTISRDIRAPNNFELFSRGNQVINAIIDPTTNISRQTVQITTGNPALTPEKADTITAGLVFQPGSLPASGRRSIITRSRSSRRSPPWRRRASSISATRGAPNFARA
ncbi:MAG: TonB-dependent receptor [Sphingomonas sp.]